MTTTDNEFTAAMLDKKNIVSPKFSRWSAKKLYDYEDLIFDYEKIEDLNMVTNQARQALFKTTDAINKYEREERDAKVAYDRTWRREYLKSTAKTEAQKRIKADLMCEELENELLVAQQMREELVRLSNTLRLELQTLTSLGNNIRQINKTY